MLGMARLQDYGKIKDTVFDPQENSKDEYEAEENILMYVFMCVCVPMSMCGAKKREGQREKIQTVSYYPWRVPWEGLRRERAPKWRLEKFTWEG